MHSYRDGLSSSFQKRIPPLENDLNKEGWMEYNKWCTGGDDLLVPEPFNLMIGLVVS